MSAPIPKPDELQAEKFLPVTVIIPRRFEDSRGWFSETYSKRKLAEAGLDYDFCQDNQSLSLEAGTLRGLHYQANPRPQAKLVRCVSGALFDVAVDIRRESPTFGQWYGTELSAENGKQLLIPAGFAHGFCTLTERCQIAYKVDQYYSAPDDRGIAWDDETIAIDWPLSGKPVLSDKDQALPRLGEIADDFDYDGIPLGDVREIIV